MTQLTVEIPDELMSRLNTLNCSVEKLVIQALEGYVESRTDEFDLTQTQTWKLCGEFQVSEVTSEDMIDQVEPNQVMTNYAENVDSIIYTGN